MEIAERALGYVADGHIVGLGSGRAATAFVHALGQRVRAGLRVRGIPTSEATAAVAREAGIPLITLADADSVDVTVDGADEVDPQLDLIKGYGAALVREKIVAAASRKLVILVGAEKLVPVLGTRGIVPVEVLPFALALCRRLLSSPDCTPEVRVRNGAAVVTDNGNYILDCRVGALSDPRAFDERARKIPGVIGTGLFLGMANVVLVQDGDKVRVLERRD